MSHVDEGTLHAYLDGELAAVERERVDSHLKGCPACQARLAGERAIIERASRLLGLAAPPERAMPPLTQLRQRRRPWWQVRPPLAWAATLVLAVGLGWFARGRFVQERVADSVANDAVPSERSANPARPPAAFARDSTSVALQPEGRLATRRQVPQVDSIRSKDRDIRRQLESAEVVTGAAASNIAAARETASVAALGAQKVATAAPLPSAAAAGVTVRGQASPVEAAAQPQAAAGAAAPRMADAASGVVTIDGYLARRAAPLMSTSWPLIARQPARDVLGVEPVVIPGFAVRAYRRNPAAREIVVEQVTDAGTTISLIERRVEGNADERRTDSATANALGAMAKRVNERLARFVGPLRIEIEGPLTPDSLSSLLELAR